MVKINLKQLIILTDQVKAEMIKGVLKDKGIECILQSTASRSVHPFTVNGLAEIKIMVDEKELENARQILEDYNLIQKKELEQKMLAPEEEKRVKRGKIFYSRKVENFIAGSVIIIVLVLFLLRLNIFQEKSWRELNKQAIRLYKQGQYEKAAKNAEKTLEIVEETFGEYYSPVAKISSNLALIYTEQGKYKEAENLYNRALEIYKKLYGLNSYQVRKTLERKLQLYKKMGKND